MIDLCDQAVPCGGRGVGTAWAREGVRGNGQCLEFTGGLCSGPVGARFILHSPPTSSVVDFFGLVAVPRGFVGNSSHRFSTTRLGVRRWTTVGGG
jgi:hypothetical protein